MLLLSIKYVLYYTVHYLTSTRPILQSLGPEIASESNGYFINATFGENSYRALFRRLQVNRSVDPLELWRDGRSCWHTLALVEERWASSQDRQNCFGQLLCEIQEDDAEDDGIDGTANALRTMSRQVWLIARSYRGINLSSTRLIGAYNVYWDSSAFRIASELLTLVSKIQERIQGTNDLTIPGCSASTDSCQVQVGRETRAKETVHTPHGCTLEYPLANLWTGKLEDELTDIMTKLRISRPTPTYHNTPLSSSPMHPVPCSEVYFRVA